MTTTATHYPLNGDLTSQLLAGHAIVTVHNTKTGGRFTYKISVCEDKPDLFFVGVLTSPDNLTGYQYLGCLRQGFYAHGRKSRIAEDAPSAKAFVWLWTHLERLPACVEVLHAGHCLRCGRTLTVPESVTSGFGPECIKLVRAA